MQATPFTFSSGELALAGTLIPPATKAGPVAVLIPGSGPLDRDSDAKRMPLGVTRLLADHLAMNGVGSLRWDKRGVGKSDGDYHRAGMHDNINDARAAVAALRERLGTGAASPIAIGHSEGAQIAIALAAAGDVRGAALLAGSAQTGEAILRWQATKVADLLPAPVKLLLRLLRTDVATSQSKRLAKIKASDKDVLRVQGLVKLNAKWLREFMAFDPAPLLRQIEVPVLAVTGSNDIQVDPSDVVTIADLVDGPFQGEVVDGVNHILRAGGPDPRHYKKLLDQPLDERITDAVTTWVTALQGATSR